MFQLQKLEGQLNDGAAAGRTTSRRLEAEMSNYLVQVDTLERDIQEIQQRMQERDADLDRGTAVEQAGNQKLPNETQRQFLIRTGKITPFSKLGSDEPKQEESLREALLNAETAPLEFEPPQATGVVDNRSHRVLLRPGFVNGSTTGQAKTRRPQAAVAKKRRLNSGTSSPAPSRSSRSSSQRTSSGTDGDGAFKPASHKTDKDLDEHSDEDSGDDSFLHKPVRVAAKAKRSSEPAGTTKTATDDLDDGNERVYQARLSTWIRQRQETRRAATTQDMALEDDGDVEEFLKPSPLKEDMELDNGYRLPGDVHPSLFDYQRTGVQWLWELYSQSVGGIVGDEMGLGKTIQVISFLTGLHYSNKITKPTIIVAPATVMKQWVQEFHTWWPPFRVSILHSSGSGMVDVRRESQREEEIVQTELTGKPRTSKQALKAAQRIINRVVDHGHVLVTTYTGLQTYAELLVPIVWDYAVLDEGHKIRNPNAFVTLQCKRLRTPNRIILSGTPIQNNLTELWSLFDFVFPMRLGNLVDFKSQFDIPIRTGGYANASNLQIQTATKCAEALKDAVAPYLLQRLKVDVAADLPNKTERVLFCKLTKPQRDAYESFLASNDIQSIYDGKKYALYGIDILRKICNHPDLQDHQVLAKKKEYVYGSANKSGKMIIVKELLNIWTKGGHKTLLFAQHRIMLDILEKYIRSIPGVNFLRMDGSTPIGARQSMVDDFNENPDVHVFLLTTKVGGLGINLTGADRVIIYDPDWNPSTDVQARERAWRLGQKREVEIYRLMVAGTIEEKIFHRQIFKQVLTNKILKDPKQRQTFQMSDLHDLFTLGDANEQITETSKMFQGSEVKFNVDQPTATSTGEDERIAKLKGVASLSTKGPSEGEDQIDKSGQLSEQRIMAGIFQRSGVHSALEHDRIVNGRRFIPADANMNEREARRVAARAAKGLQDAEQIAKSVPAGEATWTGQNGTVGRPHTWSNGPSSSSILAGFQGGVNGSRSGGSRSGGLRRNRGTVVVGFTKRIREFLTLHGGRVYSRMILDHFNRYSPTKELTEQFYKTLRELAVLQRGSSQGRGAWVLKDEYKS